MATFSYKIKKWHEFKDPERTYTSFYRVVREHADKQGWTEEIGNFLIDRKSPKKVTIHFSCGSKDIMRGCNTLLDYLKRNVRGKSKYFWTFDFDWKNSGYTITLEKKDKVRDNLKRRHAIGSYETRFPKPAVCERLDLYIYSNKDISNPDAVIKVMGKIDLNYGCVAKAEFDMENRIVYNIVNGSRDVINIINTDDVFDWIEKNLA